MKFELNFQKPRTAVLLIERWPVLLIDDEIYNQYHVDTGNFESAL